MDAKERERISQCVSQEQATLEQELQTLLAIPSETKPPHGAEALVQEAVADRLWARGLEVSRADPAREGEIRRHPAFRGERKLKGRPNVIGCLRSGVPDAPHRLVLLVHSDTRHAVSDGWPGGSPYARVHEGGSYTAPGADGGKGALACALAALSALDRAKIRLRGDLVIASVVDECLLGYQGALSYAEGGVAADAALYLGSPRRVLALRGAGDPRPGGIAEEWSCSSKEYADLCRAVAQAGGAEEVDVEAPPEGSAFLLQNYAGMPTAVLGLPNEGSGAARPEAVRIEAYLAYARLLACLIAGWCGEVE